MTATSTPPITPEERARRQQAVNFARGSVRLEGFLLDDVVEDIYARYVAGEIELPDVLAQVKRYAELNG